MNILNLIGTVTGILPLVQTIITGVEALFGGGSGPSKLAAATSAANAALETYAAAAGKTLPASTQQDLQDAINANVKIMNDLGLLLPPGSPSSIAPAPAGVASATPTPDPTPAPAASGS